MVWFVFCWRKLGAGVSKENGGVISESPFLAREVNIDRKICNSTVRKGNVNGSIIYFELLLTMDPIKTWIS